MKIQCMFRARFENCSIKERIKGKGDTYCKREDLVDSFVLYLVNNVLSKLAWVNSLQGLLFVIAEVELNYFCFSRWTKFWKQKSFWLYFQSYVNISILTLHQSAITKEITFIFQSELILFYSGLLLNKSSKKFPTSFIHIQPSPCYAFHYSTSSDCLTCCKSDKKKQIVILRNYFLSPIKNIYFNYTSTRQHNNMIRF